MSHRDPRAVTGDPFGDLTACKPDPKVITGKGAIGQPKNKRVSQEYMEAKDEKRARKRKCSNGCRVCPNPDGYRIEPHHIIRRGTPWFGSWALDNIVGLCLACHTSIHSDKRVTKIFRAKLTAGEVKWADDHAYPGYVDDVYWTVRPAKRLNPGTPGSDDGELFSRPKGAHLKEDAA
jgi:hypothetical protein